MSPGNAASLHRQVKYLNTSRNMAFEVVSLLGWRGFADVERDLLSLG
jgi:hypothetical protein